MVYRPWIARCGGRSSSKPRPFQQDVPLWSRYQLILDRAAHLFGPEIAIVNSSKLVENLSMLVHGHFPNVDLHVIHNIRDVRSFTISMLDNSRRKARGRELPETIFYRWYRDNRRSQHHASALLGRPPIGVMYEGLCLGNRRSDRTPGRSLGRAVCGSRGSSEFRPHPHHLRKPVAAARERARQHARV